MNSRVYLKKSASASEVARRAGLEMIDRQLRVGVERGLMPLMCYSHLAQMML